MEKKYIIKSFLTLLFVAFIFLQANAQIKITHVDPASETVTLHNFGGSTVNVSTYYLCNFPDYKIVSDMSVISGTTMLTSGADFTVTSTVVLDDADGELGLYLNNSNFGSFPNMVDYMQWGSANHQREDVGVDAGVWLVGEFVNVAPPYEYTGDGSQIGDSFWSTVLGIEDFKNNLSFTISPNPTTTILNIQLSKSLTNGNIKVFDILGKQILTKELSPNNLTQINVSNLSKGMYLVKVSSEGNNTETRRFIKQ